MDTASQALHTSGSSSASQSDSQLDLVGTTGTKANNTNALQVASVDSYSDFSHKYAVSAPNGPLHVHRDRWFSKRTRRRLVYKNGECNISHTNIKKRRQRFLADIFTTLVDIKWRWNLLIFILAFTLSWLLFALVWWLICFSHGDFDHYGRDDWKPCVEEVYDFTSALLFSIETQHTIGYGSRHMTPNCPEAILIMMIQSCFGVIIQALMTGLVFAKLSRPKKRAETLMFSKNAVICKRDNTLCLLFRVGDMRKSHIVEAHVRALMIKKRVTLEGEVMPLFQHEVALSEDDAENRLFLVWPVIIEHRIDEESPFWEMSPEDFHRESFELIVVMEGIVESTGMTTQARTSYLPGEILWGHRFERLVTFQKENGEYQIDYSRFHATIPVEIPQVSAKVLQQMQRDGRGDRSGDEDEDFVDAEVETTSMASSMSQDPRHSSSTSQLILKRSHTTQTDTGSESGTPRTLNADVYNYSNHIWTVILRGLLPQGTWNFFIDLSSSRDIDLGLLLLTWFSFNPSMDK